MLTDRETPWLSQSLQLLATKYLQCILIVARAGRQGCLCRAAAMCLVCAALSSPRAAPGDGARTSVVGFCRRLESSLSDHRLRLDSAMDLMDHRFAAQRRPIGWRGGHLALVLFAVGADPDRRRYRLRDSRRHSLQGRDGFARDGLAGPATVVHAGIGRQRPDGGVCAPDGVDAAGDAEFDLAQPQLSHQVAANLAFAWLIIVLFTSVIRNTFIVRLVSVSAWLVAALSIVGQLGPAIECSIRCRSCLGTCGLRRCC